MQPPQKIYFVGWGGVAWRIVPCAQGRCACYLPRTANPMSPADYDGPTYADLPMVVSDAKGTLPSGRSPPNRSNSGVVHIFLFPGDELTDAFRVVSKSWVMGFLRTTYKYVRKITLFHPFCQRHLPRVRQQPLTQPRRHPSPPVVQIAVNATSRRTLLIKPTHFLHHAPHGAGRYPQPPWGHPVAIKTPWVETPGLPPGQRHRHGCGLRRDPRLWPGA